MYFPENESVTERPQSRHCSEGPCTVHAEQKGNRSNITGFYDTCKFMARKFIFRRQ